MRLLDGHAGIWERLTADNTSLSIFTDDETVQRSPCAARCAVIRGWGATHLLRRVPHVVRVRVCAPHALRKQRMLERLRTEDERFVDEEIRRSDEAQAAIMRRTFNVDWTDSSHYDLVLNTERVSVVRCVDEILDLVRSAEFAETERSRRELADVAIQAACAPRCASTSTRDLRVVIASRRVVALSGLADDEDQSAATCTWRREPDLARVAIRHARARRIRS